MMTINLGHRKDLGMLVFEAFEPLYFGKYLIEFVLKIPLKHGKEHSIRSTYFLDKTERL